MHIDAALVAFVAEIDKIEEMTFPLEFCFCPPWSITSLSCRKQLPTADKLSLDAVTPNRQSRSINWLDCNVAATMASVKDTNDSDHEDAKTDTTDSDTPSLSRSCLRSLLGKFLESALWKKNNKEGQKRNWIM